MPNESIGIDGKLVIVGASGEPFAVSPLQLLLSPKSIVGWRAGTSIDSEDTLNSAASSGVRANEAVRSKSESDSAVHDRAGNSDPSASISVLVGASGGLFYCCPRAGFSRTNGQPLRMLLL